MDSWIQLWPAENELTKSPGFSLEVLKTTIFKKKFQANLFSGQVECSFDKWAENVLLKVPYFFACYPRRNRSFLKDSLVPKCSSGYKKCSCHNPDEFFCNPISFVTYLLLDICLPYKNLKIEQISTDLTKNVKLEVVYFLKKSDFCTFAQADWRDSSILQSKFQLLPDVFSMFLLLKKLENWANFVTVIKIFVIFCLTWEPKLTEVCKRSPKRSCFFIHKKLSVVG